MIKIFLILSVLTIYNNLYTSSDDVVELTNSNFNSLVKNSNELWLVEFYAPWCGHCKTLAPEYKKLAKALKGVVKIGAVDMTQHQNVGSPYNIKGFPTIKFFGENKSSPKDYNQARTADAMLNYIMGEIRSVTSSRMSGGSRSHSSSNNNSQQGNNNNNNNNSGDKNVILTASNFDKEVINQSTHVYMVLFYAPWCGHCKSLMPDWNRFANKLQDKRLRVGKIDCTAHQAICGRYQVNGYPTIKAFGPNGIVEDYNQGRNYESLDSFSKIFKNKYFKKGVAHLNEHSLYKEECIDGGNICIIGFLPHLIDSSKEERSRYIKNLQNSLEKNISMKISVFWVQGGDNFDLEEKLYLGAGYPSVIALYDSKKKYSVMRGSFTVESINDFIGQLFSGRAHLNDYKEIPKWKKVEKYVN